MAQWFELYELTSADDKCRQDVLNFYMEAGFPIEIRQRFAEWIEDERNWVGEPHMGDSVLQALRETLTSSDQQNLNIVQAYELLKRGFPTNEALAQVLKKILNWERAYLCEYSEGLFPDMSEMENIIIESIAELTRCKREMEEGVVSFDDLNEIWDKLKIALSTWKRHQQVLFITEEEPYSLDYLQQGFELLADLLVEHIKTHRHDHVREAKEMLEALIHESFVIEKQHPQNLKNITSSNKGIKYSLLIRFLVGNSVLEQRAKPEVSIKFHCETNLSSGSSHLHGNIVIGDRNTKILLQRDPNTWSTNLVDNVKIIGFKRCDTKKATEDVSERKYGLKVECEVNVPVLKKKIKLEAITLPLIITTQTSQDCSAAATLLWDCAFANPDRRCYDVPEKVPWCKLALVLSKRFSATTGRGLNAEQKRCLAKKLCGNRELSSYANEEVAWKSFNKNIICKNFTFWRWFYAVNNLVRKHLRKPWQEGLIHGFIDKADVKRKLRKEGLNNGNFILRFSEKNIEDTQSTHFGGGLCVCYMESQNGEREIEFVYPFMATEFEKTPFCRYLQTLELEDSQSPQTAVKSPLNFLYPNKSFEEAFAACILEENERVPPPEPEVYEEEDYRKPHKKFSLPSKCHSLPASPAYSTSYPEDQLMEMVTTTSAVPQMPTVTMSAAGALHPTYSVPYPSAPTDDQLVEILTRASIMPQTQSSTTSMAGGLNTVMMSSTEFGQGSSGDSFTTALLSSNTAGCTTELMPGSGDSFTSFLQRIISDEDVEMPGMEDVVPAAESEVEVSSSGEMLNQ